MSTFLQQQIALTLIPKLGKKRIRTILNEIDTVSTFFDLSTRELSNLPGISKKLAKEMDRDAALKQAEPYANYIEKGAFQCHFYTDSTFPKKLNQCEDAPLLLFSYGNMDLNLQKSVSIVGTRNATSYGKELCAELVSELSKQHVLVVSGLAYGIDVHVHQLCVQHNIQTVGVLAHGLDRLYPSIHRKIAKQMLDNGGLLTEFLPGTNPDRENFPMRNRIVAGMTDATIVVESGTKGGSLITAELANDYQREVFAYPGDVHREYSKGCLRLIQENKAHLISNASDFLRFMNWTENRSSQLDLFAHLNDQEKSIITCFKEKMEVHFDQIIQQTRFSFSELNGLLLNLEFGGIIKTLPGKMYRIKGF